MRRSARLVLAAGAALAALPTSAMAVDSGYQFDQFRIVGPARMVVEATAPKQVPGLPTTARGYHEVCTTSVSPILRYRLRFSAPGDSGGFGLRAQWARPGSTAYTAFGSTKPVLWEGSTWGAPKTVDQPLIAERFLPGGRTDIPTAPPVALLDLRVTVSTSYLVVLWPGYGYSVPTEQTLQTKLDWRVSSSTTCPTPPTYGSLYFKAR